MHNKGNRDLMVVLREANLAPDMMLAETEWLNDILNFVEHPGNVAASCEIINISKYKIEKRYHKVLEALDYKALKPFQFIFNKN